MFESAAYFRLMLRLPKRRLIVCDSLYRLALTPAQRVEGGTILPPLFPLYRLFACPVWLRDLGEDSLFALGLVGFPMTTAWPFAQGKLWAVFLRRLAANHVLSARNNA